MEQSQREAPGAERDAERVGPNVEFTQEIRFAVVMYGGVSLAIYMNGVAQELLRLVRATAPGSGHGKERYAFHPDEELKSTERVYRKLGQMLVRAEAAENPDKVEAGSPIRTRFVVDVLSGSSAGGINAIYLAKALANDQKMDRLKRLWVKEGDVEHLINDRRPVEGVLRLGKQRPPLSLLNSRRMYWQLLDALEGMDKPEGTNGRPRGSAANVEDLDLYVTATDMEGQPVKLQLADRLAEERRHRNVFHFRYSTQEYDHDGENDRNDFHNDYNPFLAYAARCTSAHPAAFEPMKLGDIDEVLDAHDSYRERPDLRSGTDKWKKFYEEYLKPGYGTREELEEDFAERRYFNDGGVLDNRPFSYVMEAIPTHSAQRPVVRKLLYVEPVPERLEESEDKGEARPSFVENVWRSLSDLPSYEPIREDLQRVLERNRLVDRVNDIFEGMEKDIEELIEGEAAPISLLYTNQQRKKWYEKTLAEMAKEKGLAWASYQRLRVARVTDDLTRMIVRAVGWDEDSGEFVAVRRLVRYWRKEHYDENRLDGGKKSELEFLKHCDLMWHLRRLNFVLAKIDKLTASHDNAPREAKLAGASRALAGVRNTTVERGPAFRETLAYIRKSLSGVAEDLRKSRKRLWEARDDALASIRSIQFSEEELKNLLKPQTEQERDACVESIYKRKRREFEQFGAAVQKRVDEVLEDVSRRCRAHLVRRDAFDSRGLAEEAARKTVRFYYDTFVNYDMLAYPITHAAGVGEEVASIEVFRVSPEDASRLIKDKPDKSKLAGKKLSNFGAFFKEEFRTSDIIWGQLDGAERIISTLLPHEDDREKREALIDKAHRAILAEGREKEIELLRSLNDTIRTDSGSLDGSEDRLNALKDQLEKVARELVQYAEGPTGGPNPPLSAYVGGEDPLEYVREKYEPDHALDNQSLVHNAARASRVFGSMLEGYSQAQRRLPVPDKAVLWTTRVTQLFWSLVEVAVPGSVWNLAFHHWVKLLYFFEALTIILGVLLLNSTAQKFGLAALAVTATVHTAVWLLGDFMSSGKRWQRIAKGSVAILASILFLLGLTFLAAMLGLGSPEFWRSVFEGTSSMSTNVIGFALEAVQGLKGFLERSGWLAVLAFAGVFISLRALVRVLGWWRRKE